MKLEFVLRGMLDIYCPQHLPLGQEEWTTKLMSKDKIIKSNVELADNNELHQGSNHPTISKFYRIFFPSVSSGGESATYNKIKNQ